MQIKTKRGNTYNLADIFSASAYRRIQAAVKDVSDKEERSSKQQDLTMFEMLRDASGKQYASVDAALEALDIRDLVEINEAIFDGVDSDPLAATTDSATV